MPSTVIHVAFGGLLAVALLGDEFDGRAVAIVMAAAAFPDVDTFTGIFLPGTHRAMLHTVLLPAILGSLLVYDFYWREHSLIAAKWGSYGTRIAWVSVAALAIAGIGPDLFTNGVNVLYPVHDRFYAFSGKMFVSDQQGFVQTIFDIEESKRGTTDNTHYRTGVDVEKGADAENAERMFPIAWSGLQFLIAATGYFVVAVRVWETRNT